MIKTGRPRLDDSPGFRERFATILPRLIGKEISQGQAARELDISVRSLKRYVKQSAWDISGSEHTALVGKTGDVSHGTPAPLPNGGYTGMA